MRDLSFCKYVVTLYATGRVDILLLKSHVKPFKKQHIHCGNKPTTDTCLDVGGVLRDGLIPQQNGETVRAVLAPKANGTHHLWRLASSSPISAFCCFSSVSSFMGSVGQSNYASANTVLDTFTSHLYSCGVPGEQSTDFTTR